MIHRWLVQYRKSEIINQIKNSNFFVSTNIALGVMGAEFGWVPLVFVQGGVWEVIRFMGRFRGGVDKA